MNKKLLERLGLTEADFQPQDRKQAQIEQLQSDTSDLADTVLALCDLIESGEE